MPDVAIVTLGCPKNAVDSENLGGLVAAGGHRIVEDLEAADVVLVNTCGFIDPARRETVDEILELADLKQKQLQGLVLTGCLVARSAPDLVESLPEVDALVDFAAYPLVADIVSRVADGRIDDKVFGDPGTRFDPAWWDASMAASPRLRFGRAPWSYLKIAEGCDRGCTFCAIPLMRGKLRSRPPQAIEEEARRLVSSGVKELSLVSQDSVMYGRDIDAGDLLSLLRRLERIEGLSRLRLMYLHPQGVSDELVDFMAGSEVVAHYFDLSLQHVAPEVLRGMGRWGGRARFEHQIERIRGRDPAAAVRSTFILGFPGESEADAAQVVSFVTDNEPDWVGVFTYSREAGTRSHDLEGQVSPEAARARAEAVRAAAELTMDRRAETYLGRNVELLVDRYDLEDACWVGRSHREAPEIDGEVRIAADEGLSVGDLLSAVVVDTDGTDLVARPLR